MNEQPKTSMLVRLAPLLLLVVALGAFFALGLNKFFTLDMLRENREVLKQWVYDNKTQAVALFILAYVVVAAATLPVGAVLSIAGGFLFGRVFGAAQGIRTAAVFPFNLPPIIGLSTSGGFEYQLQNLQGREPAEMAAVLGPLLGAANTDGRMARVFSTFSANAPSVFLDIDRDKASALGVPVTDIFTTLQATLGGIYVNEPCVIDQHMYSGRTYHDSGHFIGPWIKALDAERAKMGL
jgi:hypothetical protein